MQETIRVDTQPTKEQIQKQLVQKVDTLLGNQDDQRLRDLLSKHDVYIVARIINSLPRGQRKTFALLPPERQAQIALVLSDHTKRSVFPRLTNSTIARFLHFTDEDDAADILEFLPTERHALILEKIKPEKQKKIKQLFTFSAETAGGLMDLNFIIVPSSLVLKEVADLVKEYLTREGKIPLVVVVDEQKKLLGYLPYRTVLLYPPMSHILLFVQQLPRVPHSLPQERVLHYAQKRKSDVIGVIDDHDTILGVIHIHDLLRVAEHIATEDVYQLFGVAHDEDIGDSAFVKIRRRYLWLIINLGTAFLAAFVVSRFQHTIAQLTLLAAFMPIVAGEGGNAATQALAVSVRGLATATIPWSEARKIIVREGLAGLGNGLIVGTIAGIVAWIFRAPIALGIVLGSAMVINLFVAGIFGALVPFTLKQLKIDPAIASSIFVTTATDIFGFVTFLGLATLVLL